MLLAVGQTKVRLSCLPTGDRVSTSRLDRDARAEFGRHDWSNSFLDAGMN
jgi:hypothetical protein